MGGGGAMIITRSPKTKLNKQNFKIGQIFYVSLKSYITLFYLLIIDFPKFDPLTATGMAFFVNLGLSGIIVSPPIVARSKFFFYKTLIFQHN